MPTRRTLLEILAASSLPASSSPAQFTAPLPAAGVSVLNAGIHRVDANITLKADTLLMPGAEIEIAGGKTLTILGDFRAPVSPVFRGEGRVDMTKSRAPQAYPEWWGAIPNDPQSDCLPALMASVAAHPVIRLGTGDYHISDTWKINVGNRRIWGAGRTGYGSGGTRVILTRNDRDVMQVGPDDHPGGGPNEFLKSVDLRWLDLCRTQPASPVGDVQPAGLRIRFVLDCRFEGLFAAEHAVGYSATGAVRSYIQDCEAFFSADDHSAGEIYGFHFDGRTEIGLAGGNASLYVIDCNVTAGGPARARPGAGAFLQGAFADTFITRFETAAMQSGIRVNGMAGQLSAARRRSGHADLHIIMPIIDQFAKVGIELGNLSEYALVDLVDPYVAAAPGAFAALFWHHSAGLTSIAGGQFIGWVDSSAGGDALGLYGYKAEGLGVSGLKLLDFDRPVGFDECRDLDLVVAINNPGQTAMQGAVWLKDCDRGYVRARVKGRPNAFPQGVYCEGRGNRHLTIDPTGIDPDSLSGGGQNRVQRDHAQMPEGAAFESNIVSGSVARSSGK